MTQTAHTPHITHYKCITATETDQLQSKVESEIHDGWQPYGSLVAVRDGDGAKFVQPMARYAELYR